MPDVRITVRRDFAKMIVDPYAFYGKARKVVSELFEVDPSGVSVKMEHYAPGCEEDRPDVTISVSINQGDRASRQEMRVQALARRIKQVADAAISRDAGVTTVTVKAVLDLILRKTAVAGE